MNSRNLALSFSTAAAAFGALVLSSATAAQAAPQSAYVPGEVLVGFKQSVKESGNSLALSARIGKFAGTVVEKNEKINSYRIKVKKGVSIAQAIAQLKRTEGIAYAEPNLVMEAYGTPVDPSYATQQYAPQRVQADLAWDLWKPQGRTVVAIVDTGVQMNHPDLAGKVVGTGYDFVNSDGDASDDNGHGTHCAGIAAAQINNATGMAGIAGWSGQVGVSDTASTKILPVKVLSNTGSGYTSNVAKGITYAADNGAKVISLSLGGGTTTTLQNAVNYAYNKGCVIIAAAGNNSSSAMSYPAGYANVISVAATDNSDTLTDFSNYGSWVTVAAPGSNIYSTYPGSSYAHMSGTSMAAPLVAGQAALITSQNPNLTNAQIRDLIVNNTDTVKSYAGRTIGGGRVNIYRALQATTPKSTGPVGTAASFVMTDTVTKGNWKGVHGGQGYRIANDGVQVPSFAQVTDTIPAAWTWTATTSEARALTQASGTGRIASCWYTDWKNTYDINVKLTDGNVHQVALYMLDFDRQGRRQRIDVLDADSGATLDSRTASNFGDGVYLVWNLQGNVRFKVTLLDGGVNAVTAGIFFNGESGGTVETPSTPTTSASFVKKDATTKGSWKGVYGAGGQIIANDATVTASFAQVTNTVPGAWTWVSPTSDARALTQASGTGRIASCWYTDWKNTYDINVKLTDGNVHQVALYMLDFDRQGRRQRIDVLDADSGATLDSQNVTGFEEGQYLVWKVQGNVRFRVTLLDAGVNAVTSGIFFD